MVQFLSINFFFLDFFNFCWVFQKFPFFCANLYIYKMRNVQEIYFYEIWYELNYVWGPTLALALNLNRYINKNQQIQRYACIYLLQNYSKYFRCPSYPSSGEHKTVTVPEDTVTVLCTPDYGCDRHPKHVEWFCSK